MASEPARDVSTRDDTAPSAATSDSPSSSTDFLHNKIVRNIALALVVTFPFLKILYVTQDASITGEVIRLHGPSGWMDIIVDNILRYPGLFVILFVLVSGSASLLTFVGDASRRLAGREKRRQATKSQLVVVLAMVTTPIIGFLWALALFGLGWAIVAAIGSLAFRIPADIDNAHAAALVNKGQEPDGRDRRLATVGSSVLHVTALVLLPLAVLHAVLDGEAWESVRDCTVASVTEGDHASRVVEIKRAGSGIGTGWEVGTANIVAGSGCVDSRYKLRDALWE